MLVKVETRHNGDTRTPRKYRTKNLSANVSACEDTDEQDTQARWDQTKGDWEEQGKEEHSLCANILTLDRHVDSVLRRRYRPQNVRGRERRKEETRYQKRPKLADHYLRLACARERTRLSRISHGETSVPFAS